jgi:hypothetical protein
MLARLASVSRDGVYTRNPAAKPQLAYGALIMGRASMVQVRLPECLRIAYGTLITSRPGETGMVA